MIISKPKNNSLRVYFPTRQAKIENQTDNYKNCWCLRLQNVIKIIFSQTNRFVAFSVD